MVYGRQSGGCCVYENRVSVKAVARGLTKGWGRGETNGPLRRNVVATLETPHLQGGIASLQVTVPGPNAGPYRNQAS
jgi:hypothetical protein